MAGRGRKRRSASCGGDSDFTEFKKEINEALTSLSYKMSDLSEKLSEMNVDISKGTKTKPNENGPNESCTYKKLKEPSVFDGKIPWEEYEAQFSTLAELEEWNAREKICQRLKKRIAGVDEDFTGNSSFPEHMRQLFLESSEGLNEDEKLLLKDLLVNFQDVFSCNDRDLGRTGVVRHRIDVQNSSPIKQAPRRIPLGKQEEVRQLIKLMIEQDVVEPGKGPWVSLIVLVRKKDGSTRFCVDYRRLNEVTKKDVLPIPRIDEILDQLVGADWFSTLDLKSGYWQVELEENDKEKTAFAIGDGLWQFKVLPFGLCNAPATFMRCMYTVLNGLLEEGVKVYLDDVNVYAGTFKEALQRLRTVFERFRTYNMKLNASKCLLFRRRVTYLGHVVSKEGVQADPGKTAAVRDWPTPTKRSELRSFIGLCSYYRRFVKDFSLIMAPLHRLAEGGVDGKKSFVWTAECEESFLKIKTALTSTPVLALPVDDGEFIVDCDASGHALGAVLSQVQGDEEKVISYFSKTLSKPERNYCATRRELLAVVKALKHYRYYLLGRKFIVRSDHGALQWLVNFRSPEGQVARWLEQLQEYNFEIRHRQGKKHANADGLSRKPCGECRQCVEIENRDLVRSQSEEVTCCVTYVTEGIEEGFMGGLENVADAQLTDPILGLVVKSLKDNRRPTWGDISASSEEAKGLWAQWDSLVYKDGVLYIRWESADGAETSLKIILPRKLQKEALTAAHNGPTGGHFGINKTVQRLKKSLYWVNMRRTVEEWCRCCDICAARNGPFRRLRGKLQTYTVGMPLERIAVDILGPLPKTKTGNKYVLVVMDYFTKWPEAFSIPDQEAETVAKVLVNEVISRFGVPMEIHSDQGRNFESKIFKEVCNYLGVKKTRTTALHPQSDGMVERFNRTLLGWLGKVLQGEQDRWDELLPLCMLAYRTAVNEATGQTPALLMLGRELRGPLELLFGCPPDQIRTGRDYVTELQEQIRRVYESARKHLQQAGMRMKTRYDRTSSERTLEKGTPVWLYNPQRKKGVCPKLSNNWEGPYEVVKKINDVVYRIRMAPRKLRVVHIDRLAEYKGSNLPQWMTKLPGRQPEEEGE